MPRTAELSESVDEFVLCQVGTLRPATPSVVRAGDPQFVLLAKALAQPSRPLGHGMCPAYAEAQYVVLAKTSRGLYRVLLPTDACGHYFTDESIALNRGSATGPIGPRSMAANLGPCPVHIPAGLPATLNAGVQGLDKTLVPVVATTVRICKYDLRIPSSTGPFGPTGPMSEVIDSNILTAGESAALQGGVNAFPSYSAARSSLPGCGGPTYHAENFLLTYANDAARVNVEGDNTRCDPLSNGVLRVSTSSSWLDELQRYTKG